MFKRNKKYGDFDFYIKNKKVGHLDYVLNCSNYIFGIEDPTSIYIKDVKINSEFRGKGYGKKMMKEMIYFFQNSFPEYTKYILETQRSNVPAYKSYLNAGFELKKSKNKYSANLKESSIIEMIYER